MSNPNAQASQTQDNQPAANSGGAAAEAKTADEIRQGETGHGARIVLIVSLVAALVAVGVVFGMFA